MNLRANWALLEDTGTSTNVLSKAAYDLVEAQDRETSAHRRIAAAIGYVGTELAKEAPYSRRRLRAPPSSATRSPSERRASSFLGGANLGAAAYEYGLAR